MVNLMVIASSNCSDQCNAAEWRKFGKSKVRRPPKDSSVSWFIAYWFVSWLYTYLLILRISEHVDAASCAQTRPSAGPAVFQAAVRRPLQVLWSLTCGGHPTLTSDHLMTAAIFDVLLHSKVYWKARPVQSADMDALHANRSGHSRINSTMARCILLVEPRTRVEHPYSCGINARIRPRPVHPSVLCQGVADRSGTRSLAPRFSSKMHD